MATCTSPTFAKRIPGTTTSATLASHTHKPSSRNSPSLSKCSTVSLFLRLWFSDLKMWLRFAWLKKKGQQSLCNARAQEAVIFQQDSMCQDGSVGGKPCFPSQIRSSEMLLSSDSKTYCLSSGCSLSCLLSSFLLSLLCVVFFYTLSPPATKIALIILTFTADIIRDCITYSGDHSPYKYFMFFMLVFILPSVRKRMSKHVFVIVMI